MIMSLNILWFVKSWPEKWIIEQVVDLNYEPKPDPYKVASFNCKEGYSDAVNGGFSPALDAFYHGTQVIKMFKGQICF